VRIRADVRAFTQNFDYLCRVLRRLGVRPADVEDLAQEVFVVMCRRWAEYQPERSLRAWLVGISFHTAQKYFARVWRETPTEGIELCDPGPQPDDRLDAERSRWLVQRALSLLPPRDRAVLSLRELEELSMQEVADILQVPLFTAYTRLRRARTRFASAVARLQRDSSGAVPVRRALSASSVLAAERAPIAAPPDAERRALVLIRALIPTAPLAAPGPGPGAPGRPRGRLIRPSLGVGMIGALTVIAGLSLLAAAPGDAAVATPGVAAVRAADPPGVRRWAAGLRPRERSAPPAFVTAPVSPLAAGLASGLTGDWRFDEGRGSEVARDRSRLHQDCVLHEVDPESGWLSGALGGGLDVQRGWIQCPQPTLMARSSTEMTVAAWVRAATWGKRGHMAIVARQLAQDQRDSFFLGLVGPRLMFRSNVWSAAVTADRPFRRGQWVHVAFTHAADGTSRLFQDGVLAGVARGPARPDRPVRVDTPLTIGSGLNGPDNSLRGQQLAGAIDEVLTFERALSPAEVAALAAGVQPP
jgi:RNA polymerase sigma-70 factor (ECF subfamily)